MADFPSVRSLLPHGGPMVLLDQVVAHDAESTTCSVAIDDQNVFRERDGGVPVWLAIEYMAQCIGVHVSLGRRAAGELDTPLGFLVGARGLQFHVARFEPGLRLEATARRRGSGARSLVSFECELRDVATGKLLAAGRLNCFLLAPGATLEDA